jgi:hypothetical protein
MGPLFSNPGRLWLWLSEALALTFWRACSSRRGRCGCVLVRFCAVPPDNWRMIGRIPLKTGLVSTIFPIERMPLRRPHGILTSYN